MNTAEPVPFPAPRSAPTGLGLVPAAAAALTAYAVVVVVHLAAQVTHNDGLANVTQWCAVPCLLVVLAAQTRLTSRLARFAAGGLALSWVGDTLPDFVPDSVTFITLMAAFLVAHALFIAGFWPRRGDSLLGSRWTWVYAAVAVLLVVACAPRAGALTAGIAIYAAALALMSLLAWGAGRVAGVGGVLFMVSDGLLAIGEFVPSIDVPLPGFWVMATYLGALLLITLGVLRRLGSRV